LGYGRGCSSPDSRLLRRESQEAFSFQLSTLSPQRPAQLGGGDCECVPPCQQGPGRPGPNQTQQPFRKALVLKNARGRHCVPFRGRDTMARDAKSPGEKVLHFWECALLCPFSRNSRGIRPLRRPGKLVRPVI